MAIPTPAPASPIVAIPLPMYFPNSTMLFIFFVFLSIKLYPLSPETGMFLKGIEPM